ncbi:MAG: TonB-dependent receptor, partial [Bacteroidota bacterium]
MKSQFLNVLLLCLMSGALWAQRTEAPLAISASYQEQSLSTVLADLENRYELYFYYDADFPTDKKVTVQLEAVDLVTALGAILNDSDLTFDQYDARSIVLGFATKLGTQYSRSFYQARRADRVRATTATSESAVPIFTVGDASTPSPTGTVQVNGFVNDDKTGETLIGATILVEGTGQGTVSDETGQYELNLPIGEHTITISSIGYEERTAKLQVYSDDNLDVKLTKEAVQLGEVIVKAKGADQNIQSTDAGLQVLSAKEIKKLPAFLGEVDIIKSIQLLPGVSTVGEGASGFNVRGGNVDQNLTLQDGMLFFNTAHALGLFSLFNPDFVKNVNLYKGSMPAKFGGRLSSILDVELKDGNYQKFTGSGGIGLVSSRLSLEMPIAKGKSSIILGGRTSYSDWIFNVINVEEVRESAASFYDANVKIAQRFGGNGKLTLSLYGSRDNFKYSDASDFNWSTRGATVEFSYLLQDNLSMSLQAVVSDYESSLADPEGNDAFDLNNGILYYGVRPDFLWTLNQHNLNFGAQWRRYEVAQGELTPGNDISTVIAQKLPTELGREMAIYLQDDFEINDRLSVAAGLRFSIYQSLGPDEVFTYAEGVPRTVESRTGSLSFAKGEVVETYTGLEPRISLNIGIDEVTSFKLSYNKTQQFINQITNTT